LPFCCAGPDEKTPPETGSVAHALTIDPGYKNIPSFQTIDIKCWCAFCQQFTALPCKDNPIGRGIKSGFFLQDRPVDRKVEMDIEMKNSVDMKN